MKNIKYVCNINSKVLLIVLGLFCFLNDCFSQQSLSENSYRIKHWNTENGLPQNSVNAVIQSSEGYLWVGTYGGLAQFDGVNFNRIELEELKYERIISLFEDSQQNLWIGSENNGLYFLQEDSLVHYNEKDSPLSKGVVDVLEDANGNIVALIQGYGLVFIKNGKLEFRKIEALYGELIDQLIIDDFGHLWIASSEGVFRLKSIHDSIEYVKNSKLEIDGRSITKGSKGEIYLLNQKGLFQINTSTLSLEPKFKTGSEILSKQFISDENQFWYAGSNGDLFLNNQNNTIVWNQLNGLPSGNVSGIYKGADNSIWIGLNGGGLIQLSKNLVSTIDASDGLKNESVLAIHQDYQKNLWIGTNTGDFYKKSNLGDTILRFSKDEIGPSEDVWSIATDKKNNVWVGTFGEGIFHWNQNESKGFVKVENWGGESTVVLAMVYDTLNERLLIGTDRGGLFQLKDEKWSNLIPEDLNQARVTKIIISPKNEIYAATQGNGVKIIRTTTSGESKIEQLIPTESIREIYFDRENNLWMGTYGNGLLFQAKDKSIKRISTKEGLFDDLISSINEDGQSYLWMSCNNGVFRAKKKTLIEVALGTQSSVQCEVFNKSHGMGDSETNGGFQPSSVFLNDKTLLYPTMKGIALFNTEGIKKEDPLQYIHINQLQYGDTSLSVTDQVIVPKESRDLKFYFTAPTFFTPELLQFEYQLEGYDKTWKSSGNNRFANYTRLAPGNYTFKVRARNSQGVLSENIATLKVSLEPYLYEQKSFQFLLAVILFIGLIGFFLWRQYVARKREIHLQNEINNRTSDLKAEKEVSDHAMIRLAKQSAELERINKARSTFFANISHELKTPLTLIKGPVSKLIEKKAKKFDVEVINDLKLIERNSDQLNQLIVQLLDVARSEDGKLESENSELNINSLIQNLIEEYGTWIKQKEIKIEWDRRDEIIGFTDKKLVEKIVSNLLSNALKFTPAGNKIEICQERKVGQLILSIEDSGDGIEEKDVPFVFDRFYKSNNQQFRNKAGSGIGLSIVKEFVEILEGTIQLKQSEGSGAKFIVTIPFPEGEKAEEIETPIEDIKLVAEAKPIQEVINNENSPVVLVVDDHPDIRQYVRSVLEDEYLVIEASDGQEGLEMAAAHIPDIIISDVMMPNVDGIEMLQKLKSTEETNFIAVLLLTARGSEETRIEGWKEGADAYLAKPFNSKELKYRLQNILANRKKLRDKILSENTAIKELLAEGKSPFEEKFEKLTLINLSNPEFSFVENLGDFAMSRSTFQRKVKEMYQCSPQAYIKQIRLTKANDLLQQKQGSISEVAYAVGFNSVSYFNRAYKEQFSTTPSALI